MNKEQKDFIFKKLDNYDDYCDKLLEKKEDYESNQESYCRKMIDENKTRRHQINDMRFNLIERELDVHNEKLLNARDNDEQNFYSKKIDYLIDEYVEIGNLEFEKDDKEEQEVKTAYNQAKHERKTFEKSNVNFKKRKFLYDLFTYFVLPASATLLVQYGPNAVKKVGNFISTKIKSRKLIAS